MNNNGRKRGGRGGKRQIIADYIDYSTPQRMQVSAIDCYGTSHVTVAASLRSQTDMVSLLLLQAEELGIAYGLGET